MGGGMRGTAFDLEALKRVVGLVSLAVANNDMIPAMSQVWASGGTLVGFNDDVAISHPFDWKFTGTLHAATLTRVLAPMHGEATYEVTDGALVLRSRRTKASLAFGSAARPLFEFPAGKAAVSQTFPHSRDRERFRQLLGAALTICDHRAVTAEYSSPMMWQDGTGLVICGTNGAALVQQPMPLDWGWPTAPQVFPHEFHRAFLALTASERVHLSLTWHLHGNSSLIEFEDGVRLWGRRLPLRHKSDYAGLLPGIMEEHPEMFKLPPGIIEAVNAQATILRGVHVGLKNSVKRIININVSPGKMKLQAHAVAVSRVDTFSLRDFNGEPAFIGVDAAKFGFVLKEIGEEHGKLGFGRHLLLASGRRGLHFLLAGKKMQDEEPEDDEG